MTRADSFCTGNKQASGSTCPLGRTQITSASRDLPEKETGIELTSGKIHFTVVSLQRESAPSVKIQ